MDQKIVKIVYFDEGSATDFIQLHNGGSLISQVESKKADSTDVTVGAKANVRVGAKILEYIGLAAKVEADSSISGDRVDSTVAKSILANTVLTDFLEVVKEQGNNCPVENFEGRRIVQVPGSISSMSLLTPYLSMVRGGQVIPAGDLNISIDKLDSTLTKAKGYFEFLGVGGPGVSTNDNVVFRFNGNAFKNNYRPANLQKMKLKLYAVYVGDCCLDDLTVNSELSIKGFEAKDNPNYSPESCKSDNDSTDTLKMYDVILAGVAANAQE